MGTQTTLSPIFYHTEDMDEIQVEVAFQFVDSMNDNLLSFANNITTKDGGTHVL